MTEGLLIGAMDGDEWSNQIVLLGFEVGGTLWNGSEGDICGLDLGVGNVHTTCQLMSKGASNSAQKQKEFMEITKELPYISNQIVSLKSKQSQNRNGKNRPKLSCRSQVKIEPN